MAFLAVDDELIIPLVVIGGGMIMVLLFVLMATVRTVLVARGRETTKRELAAYVAEGTMDSDTAIELANAGTSPDENTDKT